MSRLDAALSRIASHTGVEQVLLVGSDGLLVRALGGPDGPERERLAAMVPGVSSSCASLSAAAGGGDFATAVVEMAGGVAIVLPLSAELLLAVVLRAGVGFSALLRELRQERGRLAALV